MAAQEAPGQVADVPGTQRFDDAQQQAAGHGADHVADAAQHGGREGLQAQHEAHRVLGHAVIGRDHHAGHGGQRRTDQERGRNDRIDVHAHQARHFTVLRGSAHRRAQAGLVHHGQQAAHDQRRNHHDGDLQRAHARAGEFEDPIIATFCRMMDTPIAVISAARRGARRSGR
ncbi:hypothetical protein G6F65_021236 [Rhizopus arrhizus]|nr:hypothetical protein G6F65_021236 [Rhizopus arrhizus]